MQDLYVSRSSAIHKADARVKFLLLLSTLLCIALLPSHAWVFFLLFFCCFVALSFLAQISSRVLFGRALISLFFSAAALPLLFTQAGPKTLLFEIGTWHVFISLVGLSQFISILIKSGLSVIAAVIFTATTRFDEILIMLRSLGLPKELAAILGLMWRYLFILVDEAKNLLRARQSRSSAGAFPTSSIRTLPLRIGTTGKMAGNLLFRALERGERIYAAMCSRGYLGEPLQAEKQTLPTADVAVILAGLIFLLLVFSASRINTF